MVAYAFVCEPFQREQPEPQAKPTPLPDVILSDPCRTGPLRRILGQRTVPRAFLHHQYHFAHVHPRIGNSTREPKPESILPRLLAMWPRTTGALTLGRIQNPVSFCGKVYTRTDALWDHLEDHFERAKGEPLVCPREECKGMVLDIPGRFKAHAASLHGCSVRVRIKLVPPGSTKLPAVPKTNHCVAGISGTTSARWKVNTEDQGERPTPRLKIIIRIGKGHRQRVSRAWRSGSFHRSPIRPALITVALLVCRDCAQEC